MFSKNESRFYNMVHVRKLSKHYNLVSYFVLRFYIKKLKLIDIKDVFCELDFLDLLI